MPSTVRPSRTGRGCTGTRHSGIGSSSNLGPLEHYLDALTEAGFADLDVRERTITARVEEWYEFLTAYHDAVLGWVGGTLKVDGHAASPEAVEDRLALMRHGIETIFNGRPTFAACWTYITARAPLRAGVSRSTLEAAPVGS